MSDAGDDVGQFIRNWVQVARRRWPLAPPAAPPALGEAYRLLSDVELEEAVRSAGFAWGKKLYEPRWPRDGHGQYMCPWLNYIALHAREWVLDALTDGQLCARAINPDDPILSRPFTIAAKRWALLTPDWERSTATCEGKLVAIAITVESAECRPQAPGTRPAGRVSPAELDRWFLQHKASWDAKQKIPPIRETDEAAVAQFGGRITRRKVRETRKTLAPDWTQKPGPRWHG